MLVRATRSFSVSNSMRGEICLTKDFVREAVLSYLRKLCRKIPTNAMSRILSAVRPPGDL